MFQRTVIHKNSEIASKKISCWNNNIDSNLSSKSWNDEITNFIWFFSEKSLNYNFPQYIDIYAKSFRVWFHVNRFWKMIIFYSNNSRHFIFHFYFFLRGFSRNYFYIEFCLNYDSNISWFQLFFMGILFLIWLFFHGKVFLDFPNFHEINGISNTILTSQWI